MTDSQTQPPPDQSGESVLVDRSVTLWVHTEELWQSLEAATGMPRCGLGRFKTWAALDPKVFGGGTYDLDAMIRWAREQGVPYTEERAVHYAGTTGVVNHGTETLTPSPDPA
jgi:hypothetical protein